MIGSLCSGYGGLDIAAEALGFGPVVWHAETDPHAAAVLAARWPGVPNLGDLATIDWEESNTMAARRNDELAQAMYDRYCQGLSVEAVAVEFGRTRQSVWKMFQRRGWDLRPRPDHDKTNNDISNLRAMPKAEHARLHGTGEVMPDECPAVDVLTAGYP